jgi:hypothetical protein
MLREKHQNPRTGIPYPGRRRILAGAVTYMDLFPSLKFARYRQVISGLVYQKRDGRAGMLLSPGRGISPVRSAQGRGSR